MTASHPMRGAFRLHPAWEELRAGLGSDHLPTLLAIRFGDPIALHQVGELADRLLAEADAP